MTKEVCDTYVMRIDVVNLADFDDEDRVGNICYRFGS